MKKDFNRLDGLLHEIRARCTGRDERQLLEAILREHLTTLENEDLLEELNQPLELDIEPLEIEIEPLELNLEGLELELEPFDLCPPCPKQKKGRNDDQG